MTCHVCQCSISEDDNESTIITYRGVDYDFCGTHNDEEYITTDYEGRSAPRDIAEITMRYDGESGYRLRDVRIYIDDPELADYFQCVLCGNEFYGYDTHVEGFGSSCTHCVDERCYFDDDDEVYRFNDDRPRPERSLAPAGDGFRIFVGEATDRFLSAPTVGFEFEHAPVRNGERNAYEDALYTHIIQSDKARDRFTCHYDGSIATMSGYSAKEIVSSPASGKEIEDIIRMFYAPFADGTFSPGPEHPSCGFHMHVSSRFLRLFLDGYTVDKIPGAIQQAATRMLNCMSTICSEYISSSRRGGGYCCDRPSVREKNMGKYGACEMAYIYGTSSYPSIAVRTIGTIEFRLWPSSNSVRYTMARAELSQKLIRYYDSCLMTDEGALQLNQDATDQFCALADLCRGNVRRELTLKLGELIGLSDVCIRDLSRMSERFNPFSHKKTAFRFTDIQVAAIASESSLYSTDYVKPDGAQISAVGDTTLEAAEDGGGMDLYLSFGTGVKCYPATGTGDQLAAVTQLAKGDL
jgi:hypothetical protein